MAYDVVIRGGLVADGRGGEPVIADVAIEAGHIVAVGAGLGPGVTELDASGLLVTPGFVDIHTHYDGQATWDASLAPSSWHGVTTAVMGSCGVGFAPVRPPDHDLLIELMEGVEDIPGAALAEGLDWAWETFPEYLDALDARPHDIDIAAQLPHGALRLYVMGERAVALEPATAEDRAEMRRLATEAMEAGAIGFSTSRTRNHKTATGAPTPSLVAEADELLEIARGLGDAGAGVLQVISDLHPDAQAEMDMMFAMMEVSGRPLSMSLAQNHRRPEGWRRTLGAIERAAGRGLPMRAQVAPRPVGVLFGLQGSVHPFIGHDAFQPLLSSSLEEKVAAMRTPEVRAAILGEPRNDRHRRVDLSRTFPLGDPPNYEPAEDTSIVATGARLGVDPFEVAYDMLLEDDGRALLFAPFANYADHNLDACHDMLAHPDTVMGLGDGGAHVGTISDGSFPTYLLAHWGRDRPHGRFEVGWLVQQLTSTPAETVGLLDRGVIAPGMRADLNIVDFDRLLCERPEMAFDLPAGGKRLLQRATGYVATYVAGTQILSNDVPTGAHPGRLVRGPQPAPSSRHLQGADA